MVEPTTKNTREIAQDIFDYLDANGDMPVLDVHAHFVPLGYSTAKLAAATAYGSGQGFIEVDSRFVLRRAFPNSN